MTAFLSFVKKVISGGQNGADQAGLRAAKECGLATGGWLPRNCRTLDGPRPEFLEIYSMQEHPQDSYVPRTEANVRDSDATIRFASIFGSPGERVTLKAIKWYNKPYFDVDINKPPEKEEVLKFLKENKVEILNVAGNSERTSPGIGEFVYHFLLGIFDDKDQ